MNKILSIDFSTTNTGYAFHNPLNNEFVVGSVSGGKSKDYMERTKLISMALIEIIEHYNLSDYFIAVEEPIITMKTKSNINLIRANGFMLAMLYDKFDMGYIDVPNSLWASYNLIKGKRPERKEQSINILKKYNIVPNDKVNDDMADAFCILLYMDSQK